MFCPYCQSNETKVIDSRLVADVNQIRRRRECLQCNERFTTFESVELSMPKIVKSDGSRQIFDEDKLRRGIHRAVEKRPVSVDEVEQTIFQIKAKIMAKGEREISSTELGETVMALLRELDEVAYVRFASVYRQFQVVEQFNQEISRLKSEKA